MSDQLSPHFFLHEFCSSQAAARMGLEIVPDAAQLANLQRLCTSLLEPIRQSLGRPMVITSGLRPEWLNEVIGGAPNSAHLTGRAADVKIVGMSPEVFAGWVRKQGFPLDQCIVEFGQWTHLSLPDSSKARNQYLTASRKGGHTVYEVME